MRTEKRAFRRLAFSKHSEINAVLVPANLSANNRVEVKSKILNVSQGGIGLAVERSERNKIKENIEFQLQSVTGGTGLPCLIGQKVKIKWILNYEPLNNMGIGCEFINLNDKCKQEMEALFVEKN